MNYITFTILLLASVATSFRPSMVVKPLLSCKRLAQRQTLVSAIGNAYLESLEQQTMQAAAKIESTESKEGDGDEENLPEAKKLMEKIKETGTAGIISFGLVQLGFWSLSLVVALGGYIKLMGHLPDWTDKEEMSKLGAEAFAYVNIARFAAPLRIGLALSSAPWIQSNLLDRLGVAPKNGSNNKQ
eukprot:scaffold3063_cov191-Amphora_coffeaeformis.AAC.2